MKRTNPKTYEATFRGRKTCVTIPDRPDHESAAHSDNPGDVLRDAIKDALGPEAVAVIANAIRARADHAIHDRDTRRQVGWFADLLVEMIGGKKGYLELLGSIGIL